MIGDGENKRREDNGPVACGEKEDGAGCARRTRRAWRAREMRAMACDGPEGENMRRAGDLTLIKAYLCEGRMMEETRGWVHVWPSGACHREEFVGDLQRGTSNSSPQHEGGNEARPEPAT